MNTIKIVNEKSDSGYCIINESDFDPKTQKKWSEKPAKKKKSDD